DDILRNRPHLACPVDVEHRDGIAQFNHLVGQLAAEGVSLDLSGLYSGARDADAVPGQKLMKLQAGLQPFTLASRPEPAPPPAHPVAASPRANGSPPPAAPPPTPHDADPVAPLQPAWAAPAEAASLAAAVAPAPAGDADPVLAAYFGTMDT